MNANPLGSTTPVQQAAPAAASTRFRPVDPLRTLRSHLVLLVSTGVVGVVIGLVVWMSLKATMPEYTSTIWMTYQEPPSDPSDIGSQLSGGSERVGMRIRSEAQIMRSDAVMQSVVQQPAVQQTEWFRQFETPAQAASALAGEHISVAFERNSFLVELSVWTENPNEAAPIVAAVSEAYVARQMSQLNTDDSTAIAALNARRSRLEQDIDRTERSRRNFLQTENIESLQRNGSAAAQQFDILNSQITEQKLRLEQANAQYKQLAEAQSQGQINITPDLESELQMMPTIARMNQNLNMLREQKRTLLARFGDRHGQIKIIDAQIAAIEQEKEAEKNRKAREMQAGRLEQAGKFVEQLRSTLEGLQTELDEARRKMIDLTDRLAQYNQIKEDLARQKAQLDDVIQQFNEVQNRPNFNTARLNIRPISQPTEAKLTFPRFIVIVPGITIALLGAVIGVIFVRELLDQRVLSPTDVRMLTRGTLLGSIPDATEDPSGSGTIDRVVERDTNSLIAEQFRQIRASVLSRMERDGHKSLLLTSPQASCGTTTIAHNLATSLAQSHRKVILVEANLRRPHLASLLGIENDRGVANVLQGQADLDQAITSLGEANFDVLTAGRSSGAISDLFDGRNFSQLMENLKQRYDLIILDAPPALLSSDSQLMGGTVDAMAVVLKAGTDKRGMADRMIRQLQGTKSEVIGVILNWVQSSAGGYFRKNYQAYYKYHETSGNAA